MINKALLVAAAVLVAAGLAGALMVQGRIAGLQADLAARTTRAERAEEKVTALEAAAAHRETQLAALQGQAAQCEEARAREARDVVERRAIMSPAREAERQKSQGGATSPHSLNNGGDAHAKTRRAVADRLNRPL